MKTAGIITFLHNDNYGSTLQAWALQQAVRSCGLECCHLDYAPDAKEKVLNQLLSGNSPSLLLDGVKKRKTSAQQTGAREKHAAFNRFRTEHLKLSDRCRNRKELSAAAKSCDLLIAGSDQIWSPVWFNPAYFLDFGDEKIRISYAASLGVSKMNTNGLKASRMKKLLNRFAKISVRQDEGAELLRNITGTKPDVMPDPVMLCTGEQWTSLAKEPVNDKPYLLCYFIGDDPAYWQQVSALAAAENLQVVIIPVSGSAWNQNGRVVDGVGPAEWLGWIGNASLVVTDSFHGACFSALMGRCFQVLRRYRDEDKASKNSRIDELMRLLNGMTDAIMEPAEYQPFLNEIREKGMRWLANALNPEYGSQEAGQLFRQR